MKNIPGDLFTKRIKSKYNGVLEVTWINGKKILNSENANYSYGALEEVMDFGLARVHVERSAEILILGLGGGNVIELLRKKYRYYGKITAVEIDPVIIEIAVNHFNIKDHKPLELICEDALEYVKGISGNFGLIVTDVFVDREVPLQCYAANFWENISRLLNTSGAVIFNAGINSTGEIETNQLLKEMRPQIDFKKVKVGTNILLLGTKKEHF